MNGFSSVIGPKPPRNCAQELINAVLIRYKLSKARAAEKKEPTRKEINITCLVNGLQFDLHTVRAESIDVIEAVGKIGENWVAIIAPCDRFAFALIESEKPSEEQSKEPPRKIGFGDIDAAKDAPFFGPRE